jgi:arylsulfatase A-like enzyme
LAVVVTGGDRVVYFDRTDRQRLVCYHSGDRGEEREPGVMKWPSRMAALSTFLLAVSLALTGCGGGADKPNIILILADDLGWGDLGCYGATMIQTPNCDLLASEGIRFTDAHSSSAVCSPSRYSVLTGRYGWRTWLKNGVLLEHMPLLIESGRLTLPALLKKKGYTTACIGKWHLGWGDEISPDWNREVSPGPLEVGFDYYFGVPFSHDGDPLLRVYVENRSVYGLEPGDNVSSTSTLDRVQRRLDKTAIRLSEAAVDFVASHKDKPFFLYYPTTNVHLPWTPDVQFWRASKAGKYGDFVAEFDWVVGQIVTALDSLGLADRTLIIVTSDNGANQEPPERDLEGRVLGHRPNGRLRGKKGEIHEGGHRVPFIARWPGNIERGSSSGETICLTDLMATAAAIVEYPLPEDAAEDSYSILPAMTGRSFESPIREATVHHSITGMFAIRQRKWKFIEGEGSGALPRTMKTAAINFAARFKPVRNPKTGEFLDLVYDYPLPAPTPGELPGQLYDLESDLAESTNVWREYPDVVSHLQDLLDRYRREERSRTAQNATQGN